MIMSAIDTNQRPSILSKYESVQRSESIRSENQSTSSQETRFVTDTVEISEQATTMLLQSTINDSTEERQNLANELNDTFYDIIGLKSSLSTDDKKREAEILDKLESLTGVRQRTFERDKQIGDLYQEIDVIYSKGTITQQDEASVSDIRALIKGLKEQNPFDDKKAYDNYQNLSDAKREEFDKLQSELAQLYGLDIDPDNFEQSLRELSDKTDGIAYESNLLIATSVSETQSFSISISVESIRSGNSEFDPFSSLGKLLDIGTQNLSDFNRAKAESLLYLAQHDYERSGGQINNLQQAFDRLIDAGLISEKSPEKTSTPSLSDLVTRQNQSLSYSRFELTLSSQSLRA